MRVATLALLAFLVWMQVARGDFAARVVGLPDEGAGLPDKGAGLPDEGVAPPAGAAGVPDRAADGDL